MAEGLLRHFYGDRFEAFSAGATPTSVNPLAVMVMGEIGIDISSQSSKSIEEFRGKEIDYVVTVCKNTPKLSCPFCSTPSTIGRPKIIEETLPQAKKFVENGFDDPSEVEGSEEDKLKAFRSTRDKIKNWILDYFS